MYFEVSRNTRAALVDALSVSPRDIVYAISRGTMYGVQPRPSLAEFDAIDVKLSFSRFSRFWASDASLSFPGSAPPINCHSRTGFLSWTIISLG